MKRMALCLDYLEELRDQVMKGDRKTMLLLQAKTKKEVAINWISPPAMAMVLRNLDRPAV